MANTYVIDMIVLNKGKINPAKRTVYLDIDDVILNLIGGLIGLACYYALSKLKYRDELLLMFMLILFLSMILLILALHFGLFGVYIRVF